MMATALRQYAADAARAELDAYLEANQNKSLLRFLTCGSVDDGKSTLIGRLLYDSKMLFEDQLAALESDSKRQGTQGENLDFALLVDGLSAEREQGITIDVAYRFFATDKRKFIVADTPGHEQYTRNMVTGASTADLAVILIDARKGVLTQTRRHSYLVNLVGIRQIVLAINKMDLVGYSRERFEEIVADYRAFTREAGIEDFVAIPISGLAGDNIAARGEGMPWYEGPTLIEHLETVPVAARGLDAPFRMAVQWVNRPHSSFRGYSGRIASGLVRPGDRIRVLPSGQSSTVERIVTFSGDLDVAQPGQSVTLTFTEEIDCSRGDVIVAAEAAPQTTDRLDATLVWMSDEPMVPHRSYWLKISTQTVSASIAGMGPTVDVNTMEQKRGLTLRLNDIGSVEIDLDRTIAATPYAQSRPLGGFILVDKVSHATVAAGMIRSLGAGAHRPVRDGTENEDSHIIWIGGPSGAERAAYAAKARERLEAMGLSALILDRNTLRQGLSADLGDSVEDEAENIRRAREAAKLMSRAGVHVLITLQAPAGECHPGRQVDTSSGEQDSPGEWSI